jgi:ATP-dependent helicase/DNAse subunit B
MLDKFTALWVSHSSISDFLQCPRAYYLKNIYKDPDTGRKFQITSAPLSLGSAVHEVIEALSEIPTQDRFRQSLLEKFETAWKKYHGKIGGF